MQYDNRGNQFFIEIIPNVDKDGHWLGQYQLAINVRRTTLEDDSFYALEQVCQMACAGLSLMEEDIKLRDRIATFLESSDDNPSSNKRKFTLDKSKENVIKINFTPQPKGRT